MSKTIDNIIAFKILYMLVTPFEKTEAYKNGIIDKEGNPLRKSKDLTSSEKDSYTNLDRLVFSLKRLIGKLPGGKSQLASIVAAYWLIKESYSNKSTVTQEDFEKVLLDIENGVTFVEEEIEIENFLSFLDEEGGIANVTGAATATDKEAIRLKNKKPISGIIGIPNYMVRRNKTNTKMG